MAADIASSLASWSTTEGSNAPAGSTSISTNLDDNLRMIQAVVRTLASSNSIASASTTDLSTISQTFVTVTGTTTITALGTVSAGIYKYLVFAAALTLTHNGTSLILPSAANITTAAGDTALMLSLGSGNWRCLAYNKANGKPVVVGVSIDELGDATAAGTIEVGAYQQTWNWDFSGNSQTGLKMLGQSTAGNRTSTYLLHLDVESTYISPLRVTWDSGTTEALDIGRAGDVTLASGYGQQLNLSGAVRSSSDTGVGGAVVITGGAGYQGAGGQIQLTSGANSDAGSARAAGGDITIQTGTAVGNSGSANGGDVLVVLGEGSGTTGIAGVFSVALTGGNPIFVADPETEHVKVGSTTQLTTSNLSGAGSAGSRGIVGNDHAFVVTMGTGSPTSATITFAQEFASVPVVCCNTSKAGVSLSLTSVSTTAVQITTSSAWADGDKLHVHCLEYNA